MNRPLIGRQKKSPEEEAATDARPVVCWLMEDALFTQQTEGADVVVFS
jgi:hypothetical protein